MVSYWIKAASNTFANTYWLKLIELIFIKQVLKISSEATRTQEAFHAAITEVCETFGI